jgi:hypothetical protein
MLARQDERRVDDGAPFSVNPPVLCHLKPAGRVVLLLAWFFVAGGHWFALQTVAWSTMMISYAQAAPLAVAVSKTFDGRHPCQLCQEVRQASRKENKSGAPLLKKLELFHESAVAFQPPQDRPWSWPAFDLVAHELREAPAVPPPRVG